MRQSNLPGKSLAVALFLILLIPATATAYPNRFGRTMGWGPVVGVTVNPDQFHFGLQADLGDIAPSLRFQPNFEVGVGDNETMGAMSLETEYLFNSSGYRWTPYLGGGIGLNFVGHDDRRFDEGSDTNAGLNLIGGLERGISNGNRFFLECKVGMIEEPDLEMSLGWTFYR